MAWLKALTNCRVVQYTHLCVCVSIDICGTVSHEGLLAVGKQSSGTLASYKRSKKTNYCLYT